MTPSRTAALLAFTIAALPAAAQDDVYRAIAQAAMEAQPNTFNLRERVPAYQFGNGLAGDDFWPFPGWRAANGETGGFDTFMTVEPRDDRPGAGEVHFHDGTARDVSTEPDRSMPGDRYYLGDQRSVFYAGRGPTGTDRDFDYIEHFDPAASEIVLHGAPQDYAVVDVTSPYVGAAIFLREGADAPDDDDLLAVVLDVSASELDLASPRFRYASPPSTAVALPGLGTQIATPSVDVWPAVVTSPTGDTFVAFRTPDTRPDNANPGCGCDLAVVAYDARGAVRWQGNYGDGEWGRSGRFSRLYDAAYADGALYLPVFIGNAVGSGGGALQLVKVDAGTGAQLGVFSYKPAPGVNNVTGIATDNAGSVFLSGSYSGSVNQGPGPYFLKVDGDQVSTGAEGLVAFADGGFPGTFFHEGHGGVAFFPTSATPGDGVVANAGWNNLVNRGNHHAMWLRRWSSDGTLLDFTQLTDGDDEPGWAWQVDFDSAGDLYVAGVVHGVLDDFPAEPYGGFADMVVFRVDRETFQVADATLVGSAWSDEPIDLVIEDDVLYLAGHTYGSLFAANPAEGVYADGFVVKMDTDLNVLAGAQVGTEREDHFTSVQVQGGAVTVAGFTEGSLFAPVDAAQYTTDVIALRLSVSDLSLAPFAVSSEPAPERGVRLDVFPNPASGHVTLRLGAADAVRVTVSDALGRRVAVVHDGPLHDARTLSLDTSGLAPGVYVVRAETADGVATRTVSVVR